MESFWIVGCGSFGWRAYVRLSEQKKERAFVLIDPEARIGKESLCAGRTRIKQEDGVAYLQQALSPEKAPDWIIPALPVHLAAEWCLARLSATGLSRCPLPFEIEACVPHPMHGPGQDLYVSFADFLCPDDCPEPRSFCTITQEPRKKDLFQLLAQIKLPGYTSLVLRSHQLAPGVGGYRPKQFFELLSLLKRCRGSVLISTACRCHGVITAVETPKAQISPGISSMQSTLID